MEVVVDVASAVLLLAGALLALVAAVGLHRLPDLYARMHAGAKPATLGLLCSLLGAALQARGFATVLLLALAAGFQVATVPVANHLLSRAGHRARVPVSPFQYEDDLAAAEGADDGG